MDAEHHDELAADPKEPPTPVEPEAIEESHEIVQAEEDQTDFTSISEQGISPAAEGESAEQPAYTNEEAGAPEHDMHGAPDSLAAEADSASVYADNPGMGADTEEHEANGISYGDEAAPAIEPASHAAAADLAEEAADEHVDEVALPGIEGMPAPKVAPGERLPVREYLDSTVVPVLREGLRKLCKERPEDPYVFLADFIKAYPGKQP